jgi:hypothetical protein
VGLLVGCGVGAVDGLGVGAGWQEDKASVSELMCGVIIATEYST